MKASILCLFVVSLFVSLAGCGSRAGNGDIAATPSEIEAFLQHNPSSVEEPYEVE